MVHYPTITGLVYRVENKAKKSSNRLEQQIRSDS